MHRWMALFGLLVYLASFVTPVVAQDAPVTAPAEAEAASTGLSNNNTYTNVDGNTVHSPAYSTTGEVPDGATARCRDGTYSFSQHAQGTCSGHGGVRERLR